MDHTDKSGYENPRRCLAIRQKLYTATYRPPRRFFRLLTDSSRHETNMHPALPVRHSRHAVGPRGSRQRIIIAVQRLGVEVIAVDPHSHAPGHQVVHRSHVIPITDGTRLPELNARERSHSTDAQGFLRRRPASPSPPAGPACGSGPGLPHTQTARVAVIHPKKEQSCLEKAHTNNVWTCRSLCP